MNKDLITIYGDFLCYRCGTLTKSKILLDKKDVDAMIPHLGVICPTCGQKVMQYIPDEMKNGLYSLAYKGYHISNINTKTVGVIFNHLPEDDRFMNAIKSIPLPYEFVLDASGDGGVSIANERICYQDFEGLDKDKYYKEAIENFTDWATSLPMLNGAWLVDLTKCDDLSPTVVDGMINMASKRNEEGE